MMEDYKLTWKSQEALASEVIGDAGDFTSQGSKDISIRKKQMQGVIEPRIAKNLPEKD